jgi:ribonuclease HII
MVNLDREHPAYDFKTHKGYVTDAHNALLAEHGPCPQHRMRFVNVRRAAGLEPLPDASEDEREPSVAACPDEVRDEPSRRELVDSTNVGSMGTSRGETA